MREICTSGSEGGGALTGSPYLYNERHAVGCYKELCRLPISTHDRGERDN